MRLTRICPIPRTNVPQGGRRRVSRQGHAGVIGLHDQGDRAVDAVALQKADGEVAQIRNDIRETARRRGELEGARDRARVQGYDDPRGNFGGGQEMIGQVIGGILQGVLVGGALDRVLRDNHRSPSSGADFDFGGGHEAPSWPSPWSQDGAASGGADEGGWRTGGTF
jgi:hypothetical protein